MGKGRAGQSCLSGLGTWEMGFGMGNGTYVSTRICNVSKGREDMVVNSCLAMLFYPFKFIN